MQLDGTVTLITGASDGIGQCVATRFAAEGARVLVHGRDPDRTQAVARSVNGRALVADLASPDDRGELIARAEQVFGRIDVLVNNAGIGWSGPFTQMKVNEIRRVLEVDLLAAVEDAGDVGERAAVPGLHLGQLGPVLLGVVQQPQDDRAAGRFRDGGHVSHHAARWCPGWLGSRARERITSL